MTDADSRADDARYAAERVVGLRRSRGEAVTVPVPLTDLLAKADDQADDLGIVIVYPEQVRALCEALRIAVNIASEAVGRLGKITDTYSAVVCSIITEPTAWSHIEYALRGNPPEGAIAFYELAERLAAVRELVDLGEKP